MSHPYQVTVPVTDVCSVPDHDAARKKFESQLVFGETFIAEREEQGWAYGSCSHDGYKGYVDLQALSTGITEATHTVTAARSHVYADSTMKSPLVTTLSFGSRIKIVNTTERYAQLDTGEWIFVRHIAPATGRAADIAQTALLFLETPYYWGGRSGFGIDCSGLVQVSMEYAGLKIPRDTDEQVKLASPEIPEKLQRGDVVYFPDHVGIMLDAHNIIHANAYHMKTVVEPLGIVAARSEKADGKGVIAVRRLGA